MTTPTTTRLGFIGAGNMAEAIARGLLRAGLYRPAELLAADPSPERRQLFADLEIPTTADTAAVAQAADTLLLAIKPQVCAQVMTQIQSVLRPDALLISILAGVTTAKLETLLGGSRRVVRVMPNRPMLVGAGMSGIAAGQHATDDDVVLAERIFRSGGEVVRLREDQMDALTALSGSGPAYVFYLAEAMTAAGVQLGLSEPVAAVLARQTVVGAAQLLKTSPDTPAEERRKVTSPGGTTHAAITTFEAANFLGLVAQAMTAAERRGKELAR